MKNSVQKHPAEKMSPTSIRCRIMNQNGSNEFKIHSNIFCIGKLNVLGFQSLEVPESMSDQKQFSIDVTGSRLF